MAPGTVPDAFQTLRIRPRTLPDAVRNLRVDPVWSRAPSAEPQKCPLRVKPYAGKFTITFAAVSGCCAVANAAGKSEKSN